jgi:hypothetical protein
MYYRKGTSTNVMSKRIAKHHKRLSSRQRHILAYTRATKRTESVSSTIQSQHDSAIEGQHFSPEGELLTGSTSSLGFTETLPTDQADHIDPIDNMLETYYQERLAEQQHYQPIHTALLNEQHPLASTWLTADLLQQHAIDTLATEVPCLQIAVIAQTVWQRRRCEQYLAQSAGLQRLLEVYLPLSQCIRLKNQTHIQFLTIDDLERMRGIIFDVIYVLPSLLSASKQEYRHALDERDAWRKTHPHDPQEECPIQVPEQLEQFLRGQLLGITHARRCGVTSGGFLVTYTHVSDITPKVIFPVPVQTSANAPTAAPAPASVPASSLSANEGEPHPEPEPEPEPESQSEMG